MAQRSPDTQPEYTLPPLVKAGNGTLEGLRTTFKLWQQGRAARLREESAQTLTQPHLKTHFTNRDRFNLMGD